MENGQAPAAPAVPAPLQQAQQVDDAIGAFANRYMDEVQAEYQSEGDQPTQDQPPVENEEEAPEAEAEAQPTEEVEALEIDGAEYQLPKALAERVKELKNAGLRQDDYTRKTQEVAESRKQLEKVAEEVSKLQESAKQLAPAYAHIQAMASRAQAIRQQLTPELRANDPIEFNTLQSEFAILVNELNVANGQVQHFEGQLNAQRDQVRRQMMAEQIPALMKEIPELAQEETRVSLRNFASKQGLSDAVIEEISYMPAAVKMLYKAMQYDKLVNQQAQAKQALKSKVQALPPVKGGKGVPPDAKKQTMKEWKSRGGKFTDDALTSLLPKF